MSSKRKKVRRCIALGCQSVQGQDNVRVHSLKTAAGARYLELLQSYGVPFYVSEFKKSHLICNLHTREKHERLSKVATISIDQTEVLKNRISAHSPTKRPAPRPRAFSTIKKQRKRETNLANREYVSETVENPPDFGVEEPIQVAETELDSLKKKLPVWKLNC